MWYALAALLLFVLTLGAAEIGFRLCRRDLAVDGEEAGLTGAQTAILILASLLLAFSFGFAGSRYDLRRQLVVREANAIGTAYLRCALLGPSDGAFLRAEIAKYTEARVGAYSAKTQSARRAADARALQLQRTTWDDFVQRTEPRSSSPTISFVGAGLNEVFDAASAQRDAYTDRTPLPILVLLFISVPLAGAVIGIGFGRRGAHHTPLSAMFAIVAALTAFTILDLDDPQTGLITNDVSAMRALEIDAAH